MLMFGWDFEFGAWWTFWRLNLIQICVRTQPSGPLCLWQCFIFSLSLYLGISVFVYPAKILRDVLPWLVSDYSCRCHSLDSPLPNSEREQEHQSRSRSCQEQKTNPNTFPRISGGVWQCHNFHENLSRSCSGKPQNKKMHRLFGYCLLRGKGFFIFFGHILISSFSLFLADQLRTPARKAFVLCSSYSELKVPVMQGARGSKAICAIPK